MNNNPLLNYKDLLIIGLGASGLSVARYLSRCGQPFTVIDTNPRPAKLTELKQFAADVPCIFGDLPMQRLLAADLLVVSPGIDLQTTEIAAAIAAGVEVVSDIGLFLQQITAPVIAVTGTNGKSTVCACLGHILSSAGLNVCVAGNIGMPVLDTLDQPQVDYYILELSSFQLELIDDLKAEVALCLNITADHLDRHRTMQQYLYCKQKIYNGCVNAVVNIDSPEIWRDLLLPESVVGFTVAEHKDFKKIKKICSLAISLDDEEESKNINKNKNKYINQNKEKENNENINKNISCMEVDSVPYMKLPELSSALSSLPQNALAVLAVLVALNFSLSEAKAGFATFNALKHRCQLVATDTENKSGLCFYNDSKATNIGAAQSSMQAVYNKNKQKIIWIAGGQAKGVDIKPLLSFIEKYVAAMVVVGEDADLFAQLAGSNVECVRAGEMPDVVAQAAALAQKCDATNIILAPACASFDEYANFQDRGDKFEAAVEGWVKACR